ncbi:MAG: serine/threonine-protein kinase [Candidatus Omnitrophota bacterium]
MRGFFSNETKEMMENDKILDTNREPIPNIPGYLFVKVLGKGSNGVVIKSKNEKTNEKVAIKMLRASNQDDKEINDRFRRELKILSRMSHPYIVKIDKVEEEGRPYIVMEYLKYSLKDLLYDKKIKFTKIDALKVVKKIAKALEYAHSNGIIHRDVKPANILFRKNGTPVLADFGLVNSIESNSDLKTDLTSTYSGLGTPAYRSPELWKNQKDNTLTDIYSLGVLLFELLSGKLPYNGQTFLELMIQHTQPTTPKLPNNLKAYQPLIDKMMAKDRRHRINATETRVLIEKYISGEMQIEFKKKQKNKWLTYFLIATIAVFLILIILMFFLI